MSEARNAIIIILILLFIIAGVGVAISRVADKEKAAETIKTEDQRGWLERIFLKSKDANPADTTSKPGSMVITNESGSTVTMGSTGSNTSKSNTGTTAVVTAKPQPTYSATATSIPATGAPVEVILISLTGLVGGMLLKKKSES